MLLICHALVMRALLIEWGHRCHMVRFVNVLHERRALLFLFQANSYIFNTSLNPLRSAHFTKAFLSFSSPS